MTGNDTTPASPRPTGSTPARKAAAAADAAVIEAMDAVDSAVDQISATREATERLRAEFISREGAFIDGETTLSIASSTKARQAVEQADRDADWADTVKKRAEADLNRAQETAARAHRAVLAEDYLSEHKRWNDPAEPEHALLTRLTETLTELLPIIRARQELHARLAKGLNDFPADERIGVPAGGQRIVIPNTSYRAVSTLPVDVADALDAVVSADAEQRRAQAQAALYTQQRAVG